MDAEIKGKFIIKMKSYILYFMVIAIIDINDMKQLKKIIRFCENFRVSDLPVNLIEHNKNTY